MLKTTRTYSLEFSSKEIQYRLNDLAFKSESEIKSSTLLETVILPTNTMQNKSNPNRFYLWERYVQGATWHAYPKKFLEKIIGLAAKGAPTVNGFTGKMKDFFDYCSLDGTSLISVQLDAIQDIVKYGSCALMLILPDDESVIDAIPKVKVIPGCDILDGGKDYFIWKEDADIFNEQTKIHKKKIYIHVEAIDENGLYYSAVMTESQYKDWEFKFPHEDRCISLIYQSFVNNLTSLPVIYCNASDLTLKWDDAYAQPIIDLTWHIFAMDADNNFALHQQSTAHLMIKGVSDPEQSYPVGLGSVHVFKESDVDEKYVAPQTAGIDLQMKKLTEVKDNAEEMLMNLVSSKNASGDALRLFIGDKTNALIGMIENVGNAIQRISEEAAKIMGLNFDVIEYRPYIDFANTESVDSIDDITNENSAAVPADENKKE